MITITVITLNILVIIVFIAITIYYLLLIFVISITITIAAITTNITILSLLLFLLLLITLTVMGGMVGHAHVAFVLSSKCRVPWVDDCSILFHFCFQAPMQTPEGSQHGLSAPAWPLCPSKQPKILLCPSHNDKKL